MTRSTTDSRHKTDTKKKHNSLCCHMQIVPVKLSLDKRVVDDGVGVGYRHSFCTPICRASRARSNGRTWSRHHRHHVYAFRLRVCAHVVNIRQFMEMRSRIRLMMEDGGHMQNGTVSVVSIMRCVH